MSDRSSGLGRQLAVTLAIALGIGLVIAFTLLTWRQVNHELEKKLDQLQAVAEIIAFNATAVIEFQDDDDAGRLLQSLDRQPDIVFGEIVSADGNFYHRYLKRQQSDVSPSMTFPAGSLDFTLAWREADLSLASVQVPVQLQDETTGSIRLVASLRGVWRAFLLDTVVYLAGAMLAFAVALLVGRHFLFKTLAPLRRLTEITQQVTQTREFSRSVAVDGADEIRELARAFNAMLVEIAARNEELQEKAAQLAVAADEAQRSALRADNANRAKSEFLAMMSHEIRTPMNGILGMAQVLLLKDSSEEDRLLCAQTILSSGQVLLALLNDVLDLAKVESGKIRLDAVDFSPAEIVRETLLVFSETAERRGLRLYAVDLPDASHHYLADAIRVRQMLSNLVSNAVKFTPQGEIVVAVSEFASGAGEAVLEFSVSDTGIGIAEDQLALLFQPFAQVEASIARRFGGTGLGLSIVRQLARLMGGDAGASSVPGKGSRFWFRISTTPATAATTAGPVIAARPTGGYQGRVLVAEDSVSNQVLFGTMLRHLGVTADIVGDGAMAAERLAGDDVFDLVLMDLRMPQLDGMSATQQIRQMEARTGRQRVPIVAVTANVLEMDRKQCLEAGMDGFLAKPVKMDDLAHELSRWLVPAPARPAPTDKPTTALSGDRPVNQAVVTPLLDELLPMIDAHLFDVLTRFQALQGALAGTRLEDEMTSIGQALDRLAFDQAAERLRALAHAQGWIIRP